MALTDTDALRLMAADKPVRHQNLAQGDGVSAAFQLEVYPIEASPAIRVWVNNTLQTVTTHYTVDVAEGIVTFVTAPALGEELRFEYSATVYSDEEVEHFLSLAGDSVTLGAVYMLLSWSADASRLAKKESLSGGGGLGAVTLDTSVRAREMRLTAEAFYKQWERDEGGSVPYEVITEIAWTPMQAQSMVAEQFLRDLV